MSGNTVLRARIDEHVKEEATVRAQVRNSLDAMGDDGQVTSSVA
jgi:antitoxin component of RelBE/YafQ-DinJ toxin-antitoxin module